MKRPEKMLQTVTHTDGTQYSTPTPEYLEYMKWMRERDQAIRDSLDYSKIADVVVDGIDFRDAPDFCDAYIASATYDGRPMTEEELDALNDDPYFVSEAVIKQIY